jgi:hypothetical protein
VVAQLDPSAPCVVHSLSSFIDQGELALEGTVGDIVEVECNPEDFPPGTPIEIDDAQLFDRCSHGIRWVIPNEFATNELRSEEGLGITVGLDGDGNATVALVAGPHCAVGDTVISVHTGAPTFESFSTSFAVEGAKPTPEGVTAMPAAQVEDTGSSSVATIVSAELPGSTEGMLRVASPELFSRCQVGGEKLTWLRMNKELVPGKELAGGTAVEPAGTEAIRLDNDGNGFAIAIGHESCKMGTSIFEADLETPPFTTLMTEFTIQPPQPTPEPEFQIEKLQEIAGSGSGFTTEPLTASAGQTVDYEIVVTNNNTVPETFKEFVDANCENGTISGGPGLSPVAPGQSTTYTCTRILTAPGTYTNVATVTGETDGGKPLPKTSNQVEVTVPAPPEEPSFSVEKLQEIAGSGKGFTIAPLEGSVGETVDYEIIVKNTGNTSLTFTFTDGFCEALTIAGGPGGMPVAPKESTVYTCSHELSASGTYVNVAELAGTPPGVHPPITEHSNTVEVVVPPPTKSGFTIEKLQEIAGSGSGFTSTPLKGTVGETVDYEIIVKNIGTTPLTFEEFSDPFCEAGTIAGGPGGMPVAPGSSTVYTCSRKLTTEGSYVNVASVTGTPPGGPPVKEPSGPVEVNVPVTTTPSSQSPSPQTPSPASTVAPPARKGVEAVKCEAQPTLRGVSGPKRAPFKVHVSSTGIKQITFYLDGRKLKTLKQSQAKKGMFTVTIDTPKLSFGAHRLSFTTLMTNTNCSKKTSSKVFVHPFSARVRPKFTG